MKHKAITIHAYWAWAIVNGHKPIELRSWKTNYRGPLLIHAGKGKGSDKAAREMLDANHVAYPDEIVRGKVIGSVDLVACHPVKSLEGYQAIRFEKWLLGNDGYYWELSNPIAYRQPFDAVGKQGFWNYESRKM